MLASFQLSSVESQPKMEVRSSRVYPMSRVSTDAGRLRFAYRLWAMFVLTPWVGILIAASIVIVALLRGKGENTLLAVAGGLQLLVSVISIGTIVAFCIMLYRLWGQVQDGKPRATPSQAVGGFFIPFYNLYWMFVATLGLVAELNNRMLRRRLGIPLANRDSMEWYVLCGIAAPLTMLLTVMIPLVTPQHAGLSIFTILVFWALSFGQMVAGLMAFGSATRVAMAIAEDEKTKSSF